MPKAEAIFNDYTQRMMDISEEKNLCLFMFIFLRNQKEVFKIKFEKNHWLIGTDKI